MPDDYGMQLAEESLAKLEREYKRIYGQAAKEMREKQRKFLKEFEHEKAQRLAALDATEEAEKAYKAWLREQTIGKQWFEGMVDELSRKATEANEAAVATLLDKVPGVYAGNANYEAYAIEKSLKARTAFTLVDEDTVRNLVTGRGSKATVAGRLLPEVTFPKIDRPKDYRWNRQKFTSAITQGILQGESIPNIVKRTESIFGSNSAAAYRAARTAVGSAQNSGRYFSMLRAEDMGIIVTKKWIATHDDRTRMSHRILDGQEVPVKEPFDSEHGPIDYPNDPAADPAETWNCRCSMKEEVGGFEPLAESYERWLEIQGMDYEEWEAIVASGKPVAHEVVEGKDILGTWKRRPDKYDFEIEDVIAAQGFDGKPRVVSADEFDAAVRRANGGDGLIMQRTYSAADKATLDAYREGLYGGKWYVDCSSGGAAYGQGMYTSSSLSGELTDQIRSDMRLYRGQSETRIGGGMPLSEATAERQERAIAEAVRDEYPNATDEQLKAIADCVKFDTGYGAKVPWDRAGAAHAIVDGRFDNYYNVVQDMRFARVDGAVSYTETMTLDPSAKIVSYKDIMREWGQADESIGDLGAYAAARGYDAINAVVGRSGSTYTVVLNRTKLIIKEP